MLLVIGLILFVCLVIVHEWGHLYAAKKGGIEVEEFGIGFPPKLLAKKLKSGLKLTFNLLPLGGFVRLKGEFDADTEPGSYGAASLKTKTKVLLAGVVMNLAVCLAILTFLAFVGTPKLFDGQYSVASDAHVVKNEVLIGYIEPKSPADAAGLKQGDRLVSITDKQGNTIPINQSDELPKITDSLAGQLVKVTFERSGSTQDLNLQLREKAEVEASAKTDDPKGYLGLAPSQYEMTRYTWSAPIVAVGETVQFSGLTLKGVGTALASVFSGNGNKAADQVSGPIGIFVLIKEGSLLGYQFILMIIAIISLTLAIMNALPIPALDGGKLFVTLLYRLLKKPLTPKAESIIHGIGFAALMVLFALITLVDVRKFF